MPDSPAAGRWRALIEEHRRSGLSYRAFCAAKDINPSTFGSWRCRLRRIDAANKGSDPADRSQADIAKPEPAFTSLTVAGPAGPLILALDHHDARLLIDADTDLELLRRVPEALTNHRTPTRCISPQTNTPQEKTQANVYTSGGTQDATERR